MLRTVDWLSVSGIERFEFVPQSFRINRYAFEEQRRLYSLGERKLSFRLTLGPLGLSHCHCICGQFRWWGFPRASELNPLVLRVFVRDKTDASHLLGRLDPCLVLRQKWDPSGREAGFEFESEQP